MTNDGTEKNVERTEIEMETSNTFKIYEHPGLFALDFIGGKKVYINPTLIGVDYITSQPMKRPISLSELFKTDQIIP